MRIALFLAAALFSVSTAALHAETLLGLSLQNGTAKQEMQGGSSAHMSLIGPDHGFTLDLTHRPDGTASPLRYGLRFTAQDTALARSADSAQPWHRTLSRDSRARSQSLTLTADVPLRVTPEASVFIGLGLGVAQTEVTLHTATATGHASGLVPRAEIALRQEQRLGDGPALIWSELSYHASPALDVPMSDGRRVRHETSGMTIGFGIAFPL